MLAKSKTFEPETHTKWYLGETIQYEEEELTSRVVINLFLQSRKMTLLILNLTQSRKINLNIMNQNHLPNNVHFTHKTTTSWRVQDYNTEKATRVVRARRKKLRVNMFTRQLGIKLVKFRKALVENPISIRVIDLVIFNCTTHILHASFQWRYLMTD